MYPCNNISNMPKPGQALTRPTLGPSEYALSARGYCLQTGCMKPCRSHRARVGAWLRTASTTLRPLSVSWRRSFLSQCVPQAGALVSVLEVAAVGPREHGVAIRPAADHAPAPVELPPADARLHRISGARGTSQTTPGWRNCSANFLGVASSTSSARSTVPLGSVRGSPEPDTSSLRPY